MTRFAFILIATFAMRSFAASEYTVVNEAKFYNLDGSEKFDGVYSRSRSSFKQNRGGHYDLLLQKKTLSPAGKILVNVSLNAGQWSEEKIKQAGSFYAICSNPLIHGEIESITIKAGTFQACKRSLGDNITLWNVDGFPFEVKLVQKGVDGVLIEEATKVFVKK